MRPRYRAAANGCIWQLGTSGKAPEDLVMRTASECELVADIELAEQARVYERVIASLEREIAVLNDKILTDCLTESERETRGARNAWG